MNNFYELFCSLSNELFLWLAVDKFREQHLKLVIRCSLCAMYVNFFKSIAVKTLAVQIPDSLYH